MTETFADPAPLADPDPAPETDLISLTLAESLRDLIWTGASTADRSLQTDPGMSELGSTCDRQLAYKILGVPAVNVDTDPMPSLWGTGWHMRMEEIFSRLDRRRWLVETPVSYRGVRGTADLYDRRRKLLIDWKSTSKGKLRRLRTTAPDERQQTQIQLYGAALRELGEDPQRLALVFVPRDGSLTDLWAWTTTPDQRVADAAVNRYERIANQAAMNNRPTDLSITPTLLCKWCDFYLPNSTNLDRACPGKDAT